MVAYNDTFQMEDDVEMGAIRRECRGLIFDKKGNLISRPFHKFFNVGEKEETSPNEINLSDEHHILEKCDGSMIRFLQNDDYVFAATKMGTTDIAKDVDVWVGNHQNGVEMYAFIWNSLMNNTTAIFEWVSPDNKIVVNYNEPNLILTAIRDNFTGEYIQLPTNCPFDVVKSYGSVSDIVNYIDKVRNQTGREGDVIRFKSGHMVKIKSDWYVRIHKTKDMVSLDKNIIDLIVNEEIDDVKPIVDEVDLKRIENLEKVFHEGLFNTIGRLDGLAMIAKTVYSADRKKIALEMMPNLRFKNDSPFIFKLLERTDTYNLVLDYCKKNISTTQKCNDLMEWLNAK